MNFFLKQDIPFSPSKFPINYGWVVLGAGIIGVVMSIPGQTMGVSVFTDFLIDALELNRLELSNAYLIGTLGSATLLTRVGKLYDRYGSRIIAMGAASIMAITLVLISVADKVVNIITYQFLNRPSTYVSFSVIALCFFLLRFSGQGVLTMVSRTMIMKWFIENRGFANALSGIAISFGFSIAPSIFNGMIETTGWKTTLWQLAVLAVCFILFAFIFFRDNPKDCQCKPDGGRPLFVNKHKIQNLPTQDYSLQAAKKTYVFWVFNLTIVLFALYNTAIIFHIADIFGRANMDRTIAFSIFIPSAFIALFFHFFGSWISDYIQLKYLLLLQLLAIIFSAFSLIFLATQPLCYYTLIFATGMLGGLNGVLANVTWPRFFGLAHLGAISGFAMSWVVAGSAIGPALFSFVEQQTHSYDLGYYGVIFLATLLFVLSWKANPSD